MATYDKDRFEPIGNEHSRKDDADDDRTAAENETVHPNPPRTTTGKVTAPKFGSAGSGGAELEPGPERD
jgi:hypothetical protein